MARKPATRVEFTRFDVVYEDGSLRSNRRVPSDVLGGLDGDAAARAVIEEQDRIIAEKSGTPAVGVKSIHRSGSKNIDRAIRPPPTHVSAQNELGGVALARGRDCHRQAYRGWPRSDDRRPVREPAHLPGH